MAQSKGRPLAAAVAAEEVALPPVAWYERRITAMAEGASSGIDGGVGSSGGGSGSGNGGGSSNRREELARARGGRQQEIEAAVTRSLRALGCTPSHGPEYMLPLPPPPPAQAMAVEAEAVCLQQQLAALRSTVLGRLKAYEQLVTSRAAVATRGGAAAESNEASAAELQRESSAPVDDGFDVFG